MTRGDRVPVGSERCSETQAAPPGATRAALSVAPASRRAPVLASHAPGATQRGPRALPPPRAPRPALGRPGLPLSTPPARPGPSGRRAVWPLRCRSPRGDGLMGAGGRRMPVPPVRLLLLPLLLCLLLLAPGTLGAPGCPVPIRGCKCSGERPKGLSGGAHNPARRRVVCGGGDLPEPPDPGLLPNGTITL